MPTGSDRTQDGELKAKVFISYSRRDTAFTDRLEVALRANGFEPLIDRTEIYAFEDWWKRIEVLIGKADTVVFILSPDSVASPICQKEAEYAASLNKRFAPIVCGQVDAEGVPEVLRRLNFIFFTDEAKFDESAALLAEALSTDIDWVRKHTQFGEDARRWAQAGRPGPRGLLLRPPLLDEAEHWIAARPQNAPLPTQDTLAFLAESRRAATRRRNFASGTLATGMLVALVLMTIAYWQRSIAIEQRNKALVTQSRFLADQANQLTQRGDQISATLVAIEGLPDPSSGADRPLVPEAKAALYGGLNTSHELAVLSVPGTSIAGLVISADGRRLATVQKSGTVATWDAETGHLIGIHGPFARISFVLFDPPGDRILVSEKSGALHVIDAMTGASADLPTGERKLVAMFGQILDLNIDWTRIILNKPRAVATIDATSGLVQSTVPLEAAEGARGLHFADRGTRIIDSKGDVWDVLTGKKIAQLPLFDAEHSSFTGVAASPDGKMIAFGGYDASARVFDVMTQKLLFKAKHPESETIKGHERDQATVYSVAFSPDGNLLATAAADASVRLWSTRTHRLVTVLLGHAGPVRSVDFLSDSRHLVTLSDDGTVRLWTSVSNNEVLPPKPYADGVIRAYIIRNAVWLIAYVDNSVVVWDFTHAKLVAKLNGPSPNDFFGPTSRAFVNRDGTRLIASVWNDTRIAWVWDLTTGKLLSRIDTDAKGPGIHDVGLSGDGRLAFVTSSELLVWDVENNRLLQRITPDKRDDDPRTKHVNCASFSPDSREIATASISANGLEIWDVRTGVRKRQLKSSFGGCVRFSPDGQRILGYEYGGDTAYILDAQSGQTIRLLRGHTHFLRTAEFSGNGRLVATSSEDSTVRIWDARTGEQLQQLTDVGGILWGQFSPDSTHIITEAGGASQGRGEPWHARIWPIFADVASMIDGAKRTAPRCLTRAQRQTYFLDPDPPAWCIETAKWPYQSQDWKDWLKFKRAHANPPAPDSAAWKAWIAARH